MLLNILIYYQCVACCHSEHYNSVFKVCTRENGIAHSTSKLDLKTLKDRWVRARRIIIRVSSRSIYSQSFIRIDEFGSAAVFPCKFAPHFVSVDGYRKGLLFETCRRHVLSTGKVV